MAEVLEIEETLTEIKELPTYKTAQLTPKCKGSRAKMIAAFERIVTRCRRSAAYGEFCNVPEMPSEILARRHPYLYADSLLG